jgi:hypothetical protein
MKVQVNAQQRTCLSHCATNLFCYYEEEIARVKLYTAMLGFVHPSLKSEKHVFKNSKLHQKAKSKVKNVKMK